MLQCFTAMYVQYMVGLRGAEATALHGDMLVSSTVRTIRLGFTGCSPRCVLQAASVVFQIGKLMHTKTNKAGDPQGSLLRHTPHGALLLVHCYACRMYSEAHCAVHFVAQGLPRGPPSAPCACCVYTQLELQQITASHLPPVACWQGSGSQTSETVLPSVRCQRRGC